MTHSGVTTHPYPRLSFRKKTRPAAVYILDVPTPGDQSYTHEDTPAESVLVSEGGITSWPRVVAGALAPLKPNALTQSSPPEVTNLSEMQRATVQSPLPIHPSTHQNSPIMQPSPTRSASQPPERPIPIRLEVSPHGSGKTHGDSQDSKNTLSYRRKPQTSQKRTVERGPRLPARPFESDIATLCDRLLAEGADSHYVYLLERTIFPNGISDDALMAPTSASTGKRWTGKAWHLLREVTMEGAGSIIYSCRLCPQNNPRKYKNSRGILRHLRKDHFGLALVCAYWWVGIFSTRDSLTFPIATIVPTQTRRTRDTTKHARGDPLYSSPRVPMHLKLNHL